MFVLGKKNTDYCVALSQCTKQTSLMDATTSTASTASWCKKWQLCVRLPSFTPQPCVCSKNEKCCSFYFACLPDLQEVQRWIGTTHARMTVLCTLRSALVWANANPANNWHENCTSQLDCCWNCTSAPTLARLTSLSVTKTTNRHKWIINLRMMMATFLPQSHTAVYGATRQSPLCFGLSSLWTVCDMVWCLI